MKRSLSLSPNGCLVTVWFSCVGTGRSRPPGCSGRRLLLPVGEDNNERVSPRGRDRWEGFHLIIATDVGSEHFFLNKNVLSYEKLSE